MDEYNDMENDAPGASGATTETVERQEHEALRQTLQIARQLELETEIIQSANLGVLKATSGNATKSLKMRQETRVTTRAGKSAEAAIKQIRNSSWKGEDARVETDCHAGSCTWVAAYKADTRGGNSVAKTKLQGGVRKNEKQTSASWIAIGNSWKGDNIVEDSERSIEPEPNQRHLGRKKKSNGTPKYKTKRRRNTKRQKKLRRGIYRPECNGSARKRMDRSGDQKQEKWVSSCCKLILA